MPLLYIELNVGSRPSSEERQALWQQAVSEYEAVKAEARNACSDANRIRELIQAICQTRGTIADIWLIAVTGSRQHYLHASSIEFLGQRIEARHLVQVRQLLAPLLELLGELLQWILVPVRCRQRECLRGGFNGRRERPDVCFGGYGHVAQPAGILMPRQEVHNPLRHVTLADFVM